MHDYLGRSKWLGKKKLWTKLAHARFLQMLPSKPNHSENLSSSVQILLTKCYVVSGFSAILVCSMAILYRVLQITESCKGKWNEE